ncbi:MAG TPA: hypothetical protein PKD83_10580 [Ignavibacteria bacterium]|nr:hypothetical protein [Ignavibacteria bacterium]
MLFKNIPVRIFIILLFFSCNLSDSFSQGKKYPFNISAWYKALSINKTDKDIADVNLTLFMTNIGSIKTLNTGLGYTHVNNNLNGVNINAGVTSVLGNSGGFLLSAVGNLHAGNVSGMEIGGLFNTSGNLFKGLQIGGAVNYSVIDFIGAQVSLVVNITGNNFKGLQIGNSNITGKNFKGVQIGTTFNAVSNSVTGLQLAPGNISGINNGVQIGLLNVNSVNNILQFGLVNITDYQKGVPIGAVNIATKNGGASWINYSSNFAAITTGLKINAAKFVSYLEGSYNIFDTKNTRSGSIAAYYGYDFNLSKKFLLTPNAGYVEIFEEQEANESWIHQFAIQGRLIGQYELSKNFRLLGGIGYSYRVIAKSGDDFNSNQIFGLAGFSFH